MVHVRLETFVAQRTCEMKMLHRRLLAEFLGTCGIVLVVVGSGIMAERLSQDVGVQLLCNTIATAGGLLLFIYLFSSISGAQFNPVVTATEYFDKRINAGDAIQYVVAQVGGACAGAMIANIMFSLDAVNLSTKVRSGVPQYVGEVVATAVLILLVQGCIRTNRTAAIPYLVPAWITAAYWSTSSTSFANPAVSVGRSLSNTFAGIRPGSVPIFVVAQCIGAVVGVLLARGVFIDESKSSQ